MTSPTPPPSVVQAVFEEDPYPHPSLLGLAVLSDGEYLFPPPATRLNKALVSPGASRHLMLYQRFKLYPAAELLPKYAGGGGGRGGIVVR